MWTKLVPLLRCPLCQERLAELSFEEPSRTTVNACAEVWIESGLLLCSGCKTWFPVTHGVPVLLPYTTPEHGKFALQHSNLIAALPSNFSSARGKAVRGEQLVMRSFSTEWLDYDFDGVIWEMDYADHEQRFVAELGRFVPNKENPGRFLEIGCGLGITTAMAHTNFGCEAVGVDLSLAAWRATATNRINPSLHFIQASVFALPFAPESFDTVYTRGVLHHTFSTHKAFRALAPLCRPGGAFYVWVYGLRSINDNLFRQMVYGVEVVMRVILNRFPSWLSTIALIPYALLYVIFNRMRRLGNRRIQPYNFRRALHAARDRFTPEFAYRQDADEVCGWFRDAGYVDLEVVDWRAMPSADHDDYRRNTGVRGRRAGAPAQLKPDLQG